jgi:uncharacterized protein
LRRTALLVLGCLLAALVAVGGLCAVGLWAAAPSRSAVTLPPALGAAESVRIPSASGSVLRGWFLPGRTGGGAVVLMHGIHSDRSSMVRRAELLHGLGFAVLLFDFQAHGESPGRHVTFGHLEAMDAAAAVDFVRRRLPDERVGAIGASLGGAAAVLGDRPLPVDALVLESVYPDIGSALVNRLRLRLGRWLGPPLSPVIAALLLPLLPPLLDIEAGDLRPIDRIGRVTAPLLVASGTEDARTPIGEARDLFARAPAPKQFWAVPGAAHVDLEAWAPDAYRRTAVAFLIGRLQPPPAVPRRASPP